MIYFSTNKSSIPVSPKKATLEGLAPDGGLYVPSESPRFSQEEIALLEGASFNNIAFAIAKKFIDGAIPPEQLSDIIESCYTFDTPIVQLNNPYRTKDPNILHTPQFPARLKPNPNPSK